MRMPMLIGLLAACSVGFISSASAQSFITTPIIDAPGVAPGEEVIVREREYIFRRRPILQTLSYMRVRYQSHRYHTSVPALSCPQARTLSLMTMVLATTAVL